MTIRITGMNSGLDVDAIIQELVSAKSFKKDKMVKAQTKLSWKQDAWKALNKKVYNFYTTTLSDMRWESSFMKKATTVSNPSALKVIAGENAMNGIQRVKVTKLAENGFLTGEKIASSSLEDNAASVLGITPGSTFTVTSGGVATEIKIDADTTMEGVVNQIRSAGVDCNYDVKNQRFFISAKKHGLANDFSITADSADGNDAMKKLGIATSMNTDSAEYRRYKLLSDQYVAGDPAATKANLAALDEVKNTIAGRAAGHKSAVTDLEESKKAKQKEIADLTADLGNATLAPDDITAIQNIINALNNDITNIDTSIADHKQYYTEDADGNVLATTKQKEEVLDEYEPKAAYANQVINDPTLLGGGAKKTHGADGTIEMDGETYTSDDNTYEINGLTITAMEETTGEVTLTTANDTSGIYDMVKNFIKGYNELIKEMDTLYNADPAKGYEPLTDEEKDAMSDAEIEKWEQKIKDSILRKDSTLSEVASTMRGVMSMGVEMNDGSMMYLFDLGINTLGYFGAAENERNIYHIDGDKDDSNSRTNPDKLNAMLSTDPERVMEFFTKLSKNLYGSLTEKMSAITNVRSTYTLYNDKLMKAEYDQYTQDIAKQQKKIDAFMDKYYAKFSAMETALARMQSKQSSITSLLGM